MMNLKKDECIIKSFLSELYLKDISIPKGFLCFKKVAGWFKNHINTETCKILTFSNYLSISLKLGHI